MIVAVCDDLQADRDVLVSYCKRYKDEYKMPMDILQFANAAGNSGGPLINMAGELIGINSMKITDTSVEGFGFALPINEVLPIITELENNGKVVRPILGISVQPIEQLSMLDKAYLGIDSKVESGLLIVKVASRTPGTD